MTWQKCPKCDGQGIVSKPPYIAGDVQQWTSDEMQFKCDVCDGEKIINELGLPPKYAVPFSSEWGTEGL